MSSRHQQALTHLLSGLHKTTLQRFVTCSRNGDERRNLLLGLELLWKIEEQVVMPALQEAATALVPAVATGAREIEIMRDLSLRIERSAGAERAVAMAALEGLVRLHCARSGQLLAHADDHRVDWFAVHQEILGLLARWQTEIVADGDIEDEERDPVGLPPR